MIELRDYQRDLLEQVQKVLDPEKARIMVQLPTGGGKTVIAAHLLAGYLTDGRKALWITHRNELATQTRNMLRNSAGVNVSPQASWARSTPAPHIPNGVVILMAQTATRRADESGVWSEYGIGDLMIIDEAHHATARGWQKIIRSWPGRVLGMTATPWRLSKREGFNHLFDDLICGPQVGELQAQKFLCKSTVLFPPHEDRIKGGEIGSIGDYTERGIEQANLPDVMTVRALNFWQEETPRRQTIIYAVSVQHAHNLKTVFNDAGVVAEVMLGSTESNERADIITKFRDGHLRVLINVAVATEGFDLPDASCIVIARPTTSLSLYLQMVGRGMRPKPNDGDCMILDLAGNTQAHNLPETERVWTLYPRGHFPDGEAPVIWCEHCWTVSPAASHDCRCCGEPFGADCQRCGKWRAWKRWILKDICQYTHDGVCDLCHKDAHLQAHLPVTEEMERLAREEDDGDYEVVIDRDELDERLSLLIQELLKTEQDHVLAQYNDKRNRPREFIAKEDANLRDDAVLDRQFEAYLEAIPQGQRPRNFPQKADMFTEWKGERRTALAASRDELAKLEAEAVDFDMSEVLANVQNRLLRILRREVEVTNLPSSDSVAPDRGRGSDIGVEATNTSTEDRQRRRRRRREDLLPRDSYTCPILTVLLRVGGEGRTRDVIEQVGEILADQFMPGDLELQRSGGDINWHNRIQWQYQRLKHTGYLDENAPRGIWQLTPRGRELAERCEQGLV